MVTRFLLLLFLSLCALRGYSQGQEAIKELKKKLKEFEDSKKRNGINGPSLFDTTKANLLYELSREHWTRDLDTAEYFAQEVLRLSEETGYEKGRGNAY